MYNYQNKIKTALILWIWILIWIPSQIFSFDLANEIYSIFQKTYDENISKNEYLESVYVPSYSKDPFGDAMNEIDSRTMQSKIAWIQYIENELAANNCSLSRKKIQWILYYFVPEFRAELVRDIKMNVWNTNNKNLTFEKSTIEKYCKEFFICEKSRWYGALEVFRKDGILREDVRWISAPTSNDIMTNCKEYFQSAYAKWKDNEDRIQELKISHAGSDRFRNSTTDDSPYDIMLDFSNAWNLLYEQSSPAITPVFYNLPVFSNSTQSLLNNRIKTLGTWIILWWSITWMILWWNITWINLWWSITWMILWWNITWINLWWNGTTIWWNGTIIWWNGTIIWWNGTIIWWNSTTIWWNSTTIWWNSTTIWWNSTTIWWNSTTIWWNSTTIWWNGTTIWWNGTTIWWNSTTIWWNSTNFIGSNYNRNSNNNNINNSQISNIWWIGNLWTQNSWLTKENTIWSTTEILPINTENKTESDLLWSWFIQEAYDDLIEWLWSKSIINQWTLFYGSLCVDENKNIEIWPEIEWWEMEFIGSNTGVIEWWNSAILTDEDYQEVIDYMFTAVNQYSTLPEVIRLRIAENLSNINGNNTPTNPEEIDNVMDSIKTCRESCEGLRIDQEASCKMMCACDEVTSADDEIFWIPNDNKLFDPKEFPWLWPIAIIRFCTVPAVDMKFSVWWRKIVSIEEWINEILWVVDKLSREWKLWIWTQQNNFLDSTTKKIKISDTVAFSIDVEFVDIWNKYNKSSQQHENMKLKNDNKSWQASYNISNPLDNPSYKNQYRIVWYTWENIKDYRWQVDVDIIRQSQNVISTAMDFYDNEMGDSQANRYISESEDLDKFLDQHWNFWNDMQKYLEDMTQYAEFLYSKKS